MDERPTTYALRCETCGDWIRRPQRRTDGRIVCVGCCPEDKPGPRYKLDRGADHDRAYHGGRFHHGEW